MINTSCIFHHLVWLFCTFCAVFLTARNVPLSVFIYPSIHPWIHPPIYPTVHHELLFSNSISHTCRIWVFLFPSIPHSVLLFLFSFSFSFRLWPWTASSLSEEQTTTLHLQGITPFDSKNYSSVKQLATGGFEHWCGVKRLKKKEEKCSKSQKRQRPINSLIFYFILQERSCGV